MNKCFFLAAVMAGALTLTTALPQAFAGESAQRIYQAIQTETNGIFPSTQEERRLRDQKFEALRNCALGIWNHGLQGSNLTTHQIAFSSNDGDSDVYFLGKLNGKEGIFQIDHIRVMRFYAIPAVSKEPNSYLAWYHSPYVAEAGTLTPYLNGKLVGFRGGVNIPAAPKYGMQQIELGFGVKVIQPAAETALRYEILKQLDFLHGDLLKEVRDQISFAENSSDVGMALNYILGDFYIPTLNLCAEAGNQDAKLRGPLLSLAEEVSALNEKWIKNNRELAPLDYREISDYLANSNALKKVVALLAEHPSITIHLDRSGELSP